MPRENFLKGLSALSMMMHPVCQVIYGIHKISSVIFMESWFSYTIIQNKPICQ